MIENLQVDRSRTEAAPKPQAPRDGIDVYSSWKVVFENTRAVEVRDTHRELDERDPPRMPPAQAGAAAEPRIDPAHAHADADAVEPARESRTAQLAPVAAPQMARVPGSARHRESPVAACDSPMSLPRRLQPALGLVPPRAQRPQPVQEPVRHAGPAEAVTVSLLGDAVTVVVRDTALSQERALRSAFVAARELTGRGSALCLLVLNGRTLYRQLQPAHPPSDIVFSC